MLLVSYHFAPGSTAGALRWQKLASLAAEHGWRLDVLTADPKGLHEPDWDRLEELPPGTRVYGVRNGVTRLHRVVGRVYSLLRFRAPTGRTERASTETERLLSSRRSKALRQAYQAWARTREDKLWARRAARSAERIAAIASHEVIVTCGPPHMAHEAGRRISLRTGLPLVMDLRDPWSLPRRLPRDVDSPLWFALARRHERRCVEAASLVVLNTEPVREAMARLYPSRADRFLTVMNGHDDEPLPPPRFGERFVVAYAGGIYLDRDPRPLFRAAAQVVSEFRLDPEAFGIELMGDVETFRGLPLGTIATEEGVEPYVRTHAPRPREEMLRFLAGAQALVSLPQDSPYAVPSKIFEYMRFPAWLLILAPPGSATAGLLEPTSAEVVDPADVERIASALRCWYRAYENGEKPLPVAFDGAFDRRTQAKRLFDALDDVVGRTA